MRADLHELSLKFFFLPLVLGAEVDNTWKSDSCKSAQHCQSAGSLAPVNLGWEQNQDKKNLRKEHKKLGKNWGPTWFCRKQHSALQSGMEQ